MKLFKKNQDQPEDKIRLRRESLQLQRLARMVDVVYAILIWRFFTLLPQPTAEQLSWEHIGSFLSANIGGFLSIVIGIVVAIIYWIQNNVLFGNLQSTDSRHTILSILQLFFLLIFLLSLRLGIELGASNGTRALESMAAALVGISGGWGWAYAIKNHRLLSPEVTEQYALSIERSYSGRADHGLYYRSICLCRTDPLGNFLAELSGGGLVGETAQAGKKGVGHIPAILSVRYSGSQADTQVRTLDTILRPGGYQNCGNVMEIVKLLAY